MKQVVLRVNAGADGTMITYGTVRRSHRAGRCRPITQWQGRDRTGLQAVSQSFLPRKGGDVSNFDMPPVSAYSRPMVGRAEWALAVATFVIGTGEFALMAVLPDMARTLGVSVPVAGHVISAYALGVVVGAPLITVSRPACRGAGCCWCCKCCSLWGMRPQYSHRDTGHWFTPGL